MVEQSTGAWRTEGKGQSRSSHRGDRWPLGRGRALHEGIPLGVGGQGKVGAGVRN